MRPHNMPSKWVKVLPWYFTERREPERREVVRQVIEEEMEHIPITQGEDANTESDRQRFA